MLRALQIRNRINAPPWLETKMSKTGRPVLLTKRQRLCARTQRRLQRQALRSIPRSLAARKAIFFEALIFTGSPVCGLRPMRAARLRTCRMPRPDRQNLVALLQALGDHLNHLAHHLIGLALGNLVQLREAFRDVAQGQIGEVVAAEAFAVFFTAVFAEAFAALAGAFAVFAFAAAFGAAAFLAGAFLETLVAVLAIRNSFS